jgi:hypothetical protein
MLRKLTGWQPFSEALDVELEEEVEQQKAGRGMGWGWSLRRSLLR